MSYLYKYTDTKDNTVKYVGIVYGDYNSLENRLLSHKQDGWYHGKRWRIHYVEIKSRIDLEAYESHYINYYETGKWFNKAKTNLEASEYLPDISHLFVEYKKQLPSFKHNNNQAYYPQKGQQGFNKKGTELRDRIISLRVSDDEKNLIDGLSSKLNLTRTDAILLAIRKFNDILQLIYE